MWKNTDNRIQVEICNATTHPKYYYSPINIKERKKRSRGLSNSNVPINTERDKSNSEILK